MSCIRLSFYSILLFLFSCGNQEHEAAITNTDLDSVHIEEDTSETSLLAEIKEPISVEDYYFLLPSEPYFEMEMGEDNESSRRKGIIELDLANGYMEGGHEYGPSFTMALFKDRENQRNYILAHRLQYPGDMFGGFFNLLEYVDGSWKIVSSPLTNPENYPDVKLDEEEQLLPVIPRVGTDVGFLKVNLFSDEDIAGKSPVFTFSWTGNEFVLKN